MFHSGRIIGKKPRKATQENLRISEASLFVCRNELFPKISFCSLEAIERLIELGLVEVWPERVGEIIFRIFARIEPVSRMSDVSSGPDDEIGIREWGTVEIGTKGIFVECLQEGVEIFWRKMVDVFLEEIFDATDDLVLSSVPDDDDECETCSRACLLFHCFESVDDSARQKIFVGEILETHALGKKLRNDGITLIEKEFIDVFEFFWRTLFDILFCECPEANMGDSFTKTE